MKRSFTMLLAALPGRYVPYLAVAAGDTGSEAAMRIGGSEIAAKSASPSTTGPSALRAATCWRSRSQAAEGQANNKSPADDFPSRR